MTSTGATNDIRELRRSRLFLSLAGALVVALTVSACVDFSKARTQARTPSPAEKSAAQAPPTGEEVLRKFYTQVLAWSDCGPNQCARLMVPIDYSHPDGDTVKLAVLKVEAKNPSERIGSLLVNPGGPGAPATAYARAADFIVTKPVRAAYDIVGVDPRGVAT